MAVQFKWSLASNFACKLLNIRAKKKQLKFKCRPGSFSAARGETLRFGKVLHLPKMNRIVRAILPNLAHQSLKGECGKFEKFSLLLSLSLCGGKLWFISSPGKSEREMGFYFFVLLERRGLVRFSMESGKLGWDVWMAIVISAENTMVIMDWIRFIIMEPTQRFLRLEIERVRGSWSRSLWRKIKSLLFCCLESWIWWFR